jgi:dTDP-4-amino-4,6-dideoxygalactose transaminase
MNIETRRFFYPVHRQPVLQRFELHGDYRQLIDLAENCFYLPSYIGMTEEVIERVANAVRSLAK